MKIVNFGRAFMRVVIASASCLGLFSSAAVELAMKAFVPFIIYFLDNFCKTPIWASESLVPSVQEM